MKKEKGSALELIDEEFLELLGSGSGKDFRAATFLSFKVGTVEIRRHVIYITPQPGPALGFHTLPQA
jgi:hypothetical protein